MEKHFAVTICRQFGAQGHEIGKLLSERMGIKLYDKDLLNYAAAKMGKNAAEIKNLDERMSNWNTAGTEGLYQIQTQMIRDIAARESCIIVGRLADYILREEQRVLKVYIYAPEEQRIQWIAKKNCISSSEARSLIKRTDAERQNYYKVCTHGKYRQKEGKDVYLDASVFGAEGCAVLLQTMLELKDYIVK